MSINGQGHSLSLVKGQSDFKVKCLTFGLYTQVSDSGPLGPLVLPFTVPCKFVFAKPEDLETWPKFPFLEQGQEFIIFSNGCLNLFLNLIIGNIVLIRNAQ